MNASLTLSITLLLGLVACKDDTPSVPFATVGDELAIYEDGEYMPFFVKGINLGVGTPGHLAGELAITDEEYERWFPQMTEAGFNAIRIYTLHHPRFFEKFAEYNETHPDRPLYLLQGIWLDEVVHPSNIYNQTFGFDNSIEEAIGAVHGDIKIDSRWGRAFGVYDVDISPWVLGYIIGREVAPEEVIATNEGGGPTSMSGLALSASDVSPFEVWVAERLDYAIRYEREVYGQERPLSFSSWPTLDPLHHPTENSGSYEDLASFDVSKFDASGAPAGLFASYHAYPYYPDFINDDPVYNEASDEIGTNNYLGYLQDLKAHYAGMPLFIAEYGVPSSWGNAHESPSGMSHGGHDELQKGQWDARLTMNLYESGCAGGALFSWIDEWWKRTWIVDELAFPRESYPLWPNVTSPEENFGMLTWELPDPDFQDWDEVQGQGSIAGVRADWDEAFFHVYIDLSASFDEGGTLVLGLDTYGDELGETLLPNGVETELGNEFALVIEPEGTATLYVTQAYDLYGIWHDEHVSSSRTTTDEQLFHSTSTHGEPWVPVRWQNGQERASDDKKYWFPSSTQEIGQLRVRALDAEPTLLDSVIMDSRSAQVRIPWTLLQVTDPTANEVMDDDRATTEREVVETEGIALSVSYDGRLVETGRFLWPDWKRAPETRERTKSSLEILKRTLDEIP